MVVVVVAVCGGVWWCVVVLDLVVVWPLTDAFGPGIFLFFYRGFRYINANFVRSYNSETTGYIASQGPTVRTLPHFVRMLWEQDVKVCVMLTRLKEGTKAKCEPYFPARLDSPMVFEDISITLYA